MELLLSKLDEKLNKQTLTITANMMEVLENRLTPIIEENNILKSKVAKLEEKLHSIEKDKRKYNVIFFGTNEKGKNETELVDYIKEIVLETGTYMDSHEISNIYRIGQATSKCRPVVVSLTTTWKKHLILKNKANLPQGMYVKEDYPKEVLEIRKNLQLKVEEERKRGNIAFIKYDKLVVKTPNEINREKRKREKSGSPNTPTQKKIYNTNSIKKKQPSSTNNILKPNILNYVGRDRSASLPENSKN